MHITARKGVKLFREYYLQTNIKNGCIPGIAKIPIDTVDNYSTVTMYKGVGDRVEVQEKIALLSDNTVIYSPFNGTVIAIENGPKFGFKNSMCYIVIKTEKVYNPTYPLWGIDAMPENRTSLSQLAKNAGIVDELRKRSLCHVFDNGKNYKTILIDAVDDEPYDISKTVTLINFENEVMGGAKIIADALEIKSIKVIILKNFITQKYIKKSRNNINFVTVKGMYPAFPAIKQFSAEQDAIRIGSKACRAIYRAAVFGEPQLTNVVTVWGNGVLSPSNIEVYNGTPVSDLLEMCGANGIIERVISGGIMTGFSASLEYPMQRWDGALTAILAHKHGKEGNCINCGRCAKACPINLAPYYTLKNSDRKGENRAKQLCAEMCVHCGACSYVCPAHIPLNDYITKVLEKGNANE